MIIIHILSYSIFSSYIVCTWWYCSGLRPGLINSLNHNQNFIVPAVPRILRVQQYTYSSLYCTSVRSSLPSELLEPLSARTTSETPRSRLFYSRRSTTCASASRNPVTSYNTWCRVRSLLLRNAAFSVSPAPHAAEPTLFHSLLRGGESNYSCQLHSCATVRLVFGFACVSTQQGPPASPAAQAAELPAYSALPAFRSGATCACFYSSRCRDRVSLVSRPSLLALPASSSGAYSHSSPEEVRTRLRLRPSSEALYFRFRVRLRTETPSSRS